MFCPLDNTICHEGHDPCSNCPLPTSAFLAPPDSDPVNPAHYQQGGIQPVEYIRANNLDYCEGNVIKYITRYKFKNGLEDLKKARRYLDWLIEDVEKANASSGHNPSQPPTQG